jgi:hypothetical protein
MTLKRVGEGGEFPGPDVSGEKEYAFAAGIGALEVLKALVDDYAGNIFASEAGEEADLGELASEGYEFSAKQAAAFGWRHVGEGDGKVAEADATEASVDGVDGEAEGDPDGAGEGTGEQAQDFDPGPE